MKAHVLSLAVAEPVMTVHLSMEIFGCLTILRTPGKTTTMVFKMLAVEMTDRRMQSSDRPSRLRQMFLTQSHVLARRVEEYYVQLLHAAKFQYSTTHQMRPVEEDLLDLDEDDDERGDLPTKFSELEDKHFPLFATFDQVSATRSYRSP